MLSDFQVVSIICILAAALVGGYFPLARRELAMEPEGLPLGQAFAAGVFLALSLIIMLPHGLGLFAQAYPGIKYPLAALVAILAFLFLVALSHVAVAKQAKTVALGQLSSPVVPVIITIMIAIPSFLLGTALGISSTAAALMIFFAIMAHKGTAAFALALSMVRSTMTKTQTYALLGLFICSTPLGILAGADVHHYLVGHAALVAKAIVLSLAAGVFLFMATLHEMKHSPIIIHCCTVRGFIYMLAGLIITAFVRLILGLAHTGHPL